MEILDNDSTLQAIANLRSRKAQIVFTNGCFDVLHVGHIRYLAEARSLGDALVVGLNSDRSVKELKGPSRPIVPEQERRELLLALRAVDFVCIFDEPTPLELIQKVCPNILVKGGDWPVEKIVGNEFVASTGGITRSLPFVDGHSTTDIIERIEKRMK
ncbi:MAG: D-glycero-beta-D-manno-heptose 1-phosphate adenylyltransferase [Bdellovibrionota bacterium]